MDGREQRQSGRESPKWPVLYKTIQPGVSKLPHPFQTWGTNNTYLFNKHQHNSHYILT